MTDLLVGRAFSVGGRRVYEDRLITETITLASDRMLTLAIVADGEGGEGRGDRAAQIAVDAVLSHLRENTKRDGVTALLSAAMEHASEQVHSFAWEQRPDEVRTTLTVAAVSEENVLYIGNIGNGGVYLHRLDEPDSGLRKLTQDHTLFNSQMFEGASRERLQRKHEDQSPSLMRVLGRQLDVEPDMGIYLDIDNYLRANQRGVGGLELRPGDSILVCSDGLFSQSENGDRQLVTEGEVAEILSLEEGDSAARMLVNLANSREPGDNISAAVLQLPDPRRKEVKQRRRIVNVGVVGTVAAFMVAALLFTVFRQGQQIDAISQLATQQAEFAVFEQTAVAGTLTAIPTSTPLPTPTPRPTLAPNEVGAIFQGQQRQFVIEEQPLFAVSDETYLAINHTGEFQDANIFMLTGTQIVIEQVNPDKVNLLLAEGSFIVFDSGRYRNGLEFVLDPDREVAVAAASLMSVAYPERGNVVLSCFTGSCEYTRDVGRSWTTVEVGQMVSFSPTRAEAEATVRPIDEDMIALVQGILALTGAGQQVLVLDMAAYLPTPTPQPSPTRPIIPTFTPVATVDPGDDYGAFNNRIIPPFDGLTEDRRTRTTSGLLVALFMVLSGTTALFAVVRRMRRKPARDLSYERQ